jgi:hypothetical protein
MPSSDIYGFNSQDTDGLLRLLASRSGGYGAAKGDNTCYIGITSGTITAKSGSVLGSGTVAVKYIDDADTLQTLFNVTAKNPGTEIASGATVIIWRVGNKWIAVEVCS